MGGDLALNFRNTRERLVPACFQFARYQPIGRVGGIILPKGAVGRVARRFKVALQRVEHLVPPLAGLFLRGNGGGDGAPGPTTVRSASSMASSTRKPPKAIQRGSP